MSQLAEEYINKLENESLAEVATQEKPTIWANTYLLKSVLASDLRSIFDMLGSERAEITVKSAVTLSTPVFLQTVLSLKSEYYQKLMSEGSGDIDKETLQQQLEHVLTYTKILVTTVNAHAEHAISQEGVDPFDAIAKTVSKFKPKYPDKWPPETDEERQAIRDVDKKISNRPDGFRSDALLDVDASVCRHSHTLSNEVCESRGLEPYSCQMKLKKGNEITGHMLTIVFEEGDKNRPVFIDGQNGITAKGFDGYKQAWAKFGWEITGAEASRLVSNENGSSWDTVNF